MPHVASPAQLFEAEFGARLRRLRTSGITVRCEGAEHRLAFEGGSLAVLDHDEEAEAVVEAMGGAVPACVLVARSLASAEVPELWAALSPGQVSPWRAVDDDVLRLFLARALAAEFEGAGRAVRDSVGQLGLALLATAGPTVELLAAKYRMTREFPRWDPGRGPWTDKELVLLSRYVRGSPGAPPHLELLPRDDAGRRAVARYSAGLLDDARVHTSQDLRTLLSPLFRNVRALTSLLVSEGLLEHDNGRYRVRGRQTRRR